MAKVTKIYEDPIIRMDVAKAMEAFDLAIATAIDDAVDAGIPFILILTLLQTHHTLVTLQMVQMENEE